MNQILSATSAFQLLIQSAADAIDARKQGEDVGIIQNWMNQDEGIAIVLAFRIIDEFEHEISPQLMTSMLMQYCHDGLTDAFVDFYCQLSQKAGINAAPSELRKLQFIPMIDIRQFAMTGKSLGWKQSWGPFKEPHATEWAAGFS